MTRNHDIQAVVGLGNPGGKYRYSRHNIGYRIIEALAAISTPSKSSKQKGWIRRFIAERKGGRAGSITNRPSWQSMPVGRLCHVLMAGQEILLFEPGLYMNRSGMALQGLMQTTGIPLSSMLVLVDDIDLPLGRLRLRASGGPGSHNGLKNICTVLGSDFPRLRFGIRGEEEWQDLADYVLSGFSPKEELVLEERVRKACKAIQLSVEAGISAAMNRVNRSGEPLENPKKT